MGKGVLKGVGMVLRVLVLDEVEGITFRKEWFWNKCTCVMFRENCLKQTILTADLRL